MRIRTFVAAGAILLASFSLFADTPGGRAEVRMVYDPTSTHIILYGGATAIDGGTKLSYDLSDTWEWVGDRWVRRATVHDAGPRSAQAMVYDSNRSRIVMFGGRRMDLSTKLPTTLNDTWVFQNGDWSQLNTPNMPSARMQPGAAYDPIRDRVVLFGGNVVSTDGKGTVTAIHDTWEFDGTTWVQRGAQNSPAISKPIVTYDQANHQIIMVGNDEGSTSKTSPLMYTYDPATGNWNSINPDGLPPCVNESQVAFDGETNSVILTGGACSNSDTLDATYSWDGSKWTKVDVGSTTQDRTFGGGMAYDPTRQMMILYGGTIAFGSTKLGTLGFRTNLWATVPDTYSPTPRSLPLVFSYPGSGVVNIYAGQDETQSYDEFWAYSNGQWTQVTGDNRPSTCDNPLGAYDTDKKIYEIVCQAGNVWSFDGTNWTNAKDSKDKPTLARLRGLAYDQTLKKLVLFGGYDDTEFLDQTWLWDGTNWTRVKKNPPYLRAQAVVWYDQTLKKTIVYGGIGRKDKDSRVERFADMWSFDGTGWTDMKVDTTTTPGMRYSTSYTIDPRTGHLFVFGGIYYTKDTTGATTVESQVYVNDLWEWDGSKWKKLAESNAPDNRENSGFTFDPSTNRMTLFGGYGGHYFGDLWLLDTANGAWQPLFQTNAGNRRRTGPISQVPAPGGVMRNGQE